MGLVYITPFVRKGLTEYIESGITTNRSFASVSSSKIIEVYTSTPEQYRMRARFINPQTLDFGSSTIIEEDFAHGGYGASGNRCYVALVSPTRAVAVTLPYGYSFMSAYLIDVSGTSPVLLDSLQISASGYVPYGIVGCNNKATVFHYRNSPRAIYATLISYDSNTETISAGSAATMSTATTASFENSVLVNPSTGYSFVAWSTTPGYITSFNNTTILANRLDTQYHTNVNNVEGNVITLNGSSQGMVIFKNTSGSYISARRINITEGSAPTFGTMYTINTPFSYHEAYPIDSDKSVLFYQGAIGVDDHTYYQIFDKSSGEVLPSGSPVQIGGTGIALNMAGINLGNNDLLIRRRSDSTTIDTIYYKFTY